MSRRSRFIAPLALDAVYASLLLALGPWLLWRALRTGRYRAGWAAKLLGQAPPRDASRPGAWFHAVSVGEVNLLAPLIAEWRRRRPDWDCVLSTTTQTGFAVARAKYPELAVFYAPLDFSWATRRAMRRIGPRLLVLAELELWPNLIAAAQAAGARVAVVNGRLSDRSFRGYRNIRRLLGPTLAGIDAVAAQSEEYARRFARLGIPRKKVAMTGSMKFDGARTDRTNAATRSLKLLAGVADDDFVFLAGSTQAPEEALAIETFRALAAEFPQLRLILVPRHPERFQAVANLLAASGLAWQRRSELERRGASAAARVLLVDRVGELGAWWGMAHVAFVGGSLGPRGGQNMIEPAAYGAAVSFGPRTENFRDVVAMLVAADAVVVVGDGRELTAFVRRTLAEPRYPVELGERGKAVVLANQGATARTADLLERLAGLCPPGAPAAYRRSA